MNEYYGYFGLIFFFIHLIVTRVVRNKFKSKIYFELLTLASLVLMMAVAYPSQIKSRLMSPTSTEQTQILRKFDMSDFDNYAINFDKLTQGSIKNLTKKFRKIPLSQNTETESRYYAFGIALPLITIILFAFNVRHFSHDAKKYALIVFLSSVIFSTFLVSPSIPFAGSKITLNLAPMFRVLCRGNIYLLLSLLAQFFILGIFHSKRKKSYVAFSVCLALVAVDLTELNFIRPVKTHPLPNLEHVAAIKRDILNQDPGKTKDLTVLSLPFFTVHNPPHFNHLYKYELAYLDIRMANIEIASTDGNPHQEELTRCGERLNIGDENMIKTLLKNGIHYLILHDDIARSFNPNSFRSGQVVYKSDSIVVLRGDLTSQLPMHFYKWVQGIPGYGK
jgi:hypothetical protein